LALTKEAQRMLVQQYKIEEGYWRVNFNDGLFEECSAFLIFSKKSQGK